MRSSSLIVWVALATIHVVCGCEQLKCFDHVLNRKVNDQIAVELTGHYTYLYLAQVFEKHTNHYPNVAKYLRAKSAEELTHAERFIEYQNQRGGTVDMTSVSRYQHSDSAGDCYNVQDVTSAFKCAMKLEAFVTSALTQLHEIASSVTVPRPCTLEAIPDDDLRWFQPMLVTCEPDGGGNDVTTSSFAPCDCNNIKSVNYVELAEMIAHEFLGHQVEDTKEIANHYRTLMKIKGQNGQGLGEYLFDKHLEL